MDNPGTNLCNIATEGMGQHIESIAQLKLMFGRIHLCNTSRVHVTYPLQLSISFFVGLMGSSVTSPIVGMRLTPANLGAPLIFTVIWVRPNLLLLPLRFPPPLAVRLGAIFLMRALRARLK